MVGKQLVQILTQNMDPGKYNRNILYTWEE